MDYQPLGRTGVSVSQLCLGAMMLGAFGNPDHDDAVRIIHKALAGGRRASVVLAVKFGPPFGEDPNHRGASRRWITEGVEGSLRRLQTDWIDLYQGGVPDPNTDIDETPRALSDLVHARKDRSLGPSQVPALPVSQARVTAVTSAISGPRTMEPLDPSLAASGIDLSSDVLDRIDQIVPPGVTINIADNMWNIGTPALSAAFRRR